MPEVSLSFVLSITLILFGVLSIDERHSRRAILLGVLLTLSGIALLPLHLLLRILLLLVIFFPLAYFGLGVRECNCYFTFIPEGTAKAIVRGDAWDKTLMQWDNHTLDNDGNVVPVDVWVKDGQKVEKGTPGAEKYEKSKYLLGGFRWYGWWPILDVYIHRFRWTGIKESGEIDPHPTEILDYILLRPDTYYCKVEDAEDKNGLPLTIELTLTMGICNPKKALFDIENWLETVINRIKPGVRDYVGQWIYKDLIGKKQAMGGELEKMLETTIEEFRKAYGVNVIHIEVRDIKPHKDYLDATIKEYVAEQTAKATVAEAKGQKEAIKITADGEVLRIRRVFKEIEKFGDLGKLVRTLEAVEKSTLAASLAVQQITGLPELLRGIFGKSTEEVTKEDLRKLREELEKTIKEALSSIKGS